MTAKVSRSELANALAEVRANMVITRKQRQKQGLERMLGTLQQLREATHLHDALRSAPVKGMSRRRIGVEARLSTVPCDEMHKRTFNQV